MVPVLAISFVLAPYAWFDFVRIIPNLLSGPTLFENNLSLHSLATYGLPGLPWGPEVARAISVAVGLGALAGSVVLARRREGWPAALTLAVAALLLVPSSTWYHYLCMLLPLAAFAWPRADRRIRAGLIAGRCLDHLRPGGHTHHCRRCRLDGWFDIGRRLAAQDSQRVTALSARLSAGVPAGVRDYFADPARRRLILFALSAAGYGFGLASLVVLVSDPLTDGGLGYDSYAYWLAGQNVLHGQPLYSSVAVDALGAYKYPPIFAQLIAPLTLIPALAFSWLWRIACFLCVRWLAGSWRNVGLWLLVPLTIIAVAGQRHLHGGRSDGSRHAQPGLAYRTYGRPQVRAHLRRAVSLAGQSQAAPLTRGRRAPLRRRLRHQLRLEPNRLGRLHRLPVPLYDRRYDRPGCYRAVAHRRGRPRDSPGHCRRP